MYIIVMDLSMKPTVSVNCHSLSPMVLETTLFTPDINSLFPDVDECQAKTHLCEHNCTNAIPGYTCSCNSGYSLAGNGHACVGKSTILRTMQAPL